MWRVRACFAVDLDDSKRDLARARTGVLAPDVECLGRGPVPAGDLSVCKYISLLHREKDYLNGILRDDARLCRCEIAFEEWPCASILSRSHCSALFLIHSPYRDTRNRKMRRPGSKGGGTRAQREGTTFRLEQSKTGSSSVDHLFGADRPKGKAILDHSWGNNGPGTLLTSYSRQHHVAGSVECWICSRHGTPTRAVPAASWQLAFGEYPNTYSWLLRRTKVLD